MSDSLYAAISGLNASQQMMGVVSQNVANVNTVGYKSSVANFAEALQQTLTGAGAPTANVGGTNPIQFTAGGAVNLSGVEVNTSQGQLTSTGINTNLAIQGGGYFIVQQASGGRAYTRAGNFSVDKKGNLVNPQGDRVLGWAANAQGVIANESKSTLAPVVIPQTTMPPAQSTAITLSGNFDSNVTGSNAASASAVTVPVTVYDSLGAPISVDLQFTPSTTANSWTLSGYSVNGGSTTTSGITSSTLSFNSSGQITASPAGSLSIANSADGTTTTIALGTATFSGLTGYSDTTTANATADGNAPGTLVNFNVNGQGQIIGSYSNGLTQPIAAVAVAAFNNPAGLTNVGNNLWHTSANSGSSVVGPANSGPRGSILAGSLEGSNVDLAGEFVNMIIAQQGYEANAKVITVDQTLRQALTSMVQ